MGEVLIIFSEIKDKNELIKVLNKRGSKSAALRVSKMDDIEFQKAIPKLNKEIENVRESCSVVSDSVKQLLKDLDSDTGLTLEIAVAILNIASDYVMAMKAANMSGITPIDTVETVARKLEETLVVERLGRYLQ